MKRVFSFWVLVLLPVLVFAQDYCADSRLIANNPTSAYVLHDDGTVTDPRTGLMWKRCAEGQAWDAAASTCTGEATSLAWGAALAAGDTGFAGHADWRLPNIKELASLVEICRFQPAINEEVFPAPATIANYWSSSPVGETGNAWSLVIGTGYTLEIIGIGVDLGFGARLVRDVTAD